MGGRRAVLRSEERGTVVAQLEVVAFHRYHAGDVRLWKIHFRNFFALVSICKVITFISSTDLSVERNFFVSLDIGCCAKSTGISTEESA